MTLQTMLSVRMLRSIRRPSSATPSTSASWPLFAVITATLLICMKISTIDAHGPGPGQQQLQPQQQQQQQLQLQQIQLHLQQQPFQQFSNFIYPRRRSSADGFSSQMQSRAVDTRVPLEILENEPRGTVVGYIPTKIGFTYRFNEPPREFTLDPNTGEIKTNVVLDREIRDRYDLVVLSSQPTYPIEVRIYECKTIVYHFILLCFFFFQFILGANQCIGCQR